MTDLQSAKQLLLEGEHTCVLRKNEIVYTSTLRGVKPLVIWLSSDEDFHGFSAADKVIGKATAFLYVLLGVKAVYASVISKGALDVLTKNGIDTQCGCVVEHIINRTGDGICPFEVAVADITDADSAYTAIRRKMEQLHISL